MPKLQLSRLSRLARSTRMVRIAVLALSTLVLSPALPGATTDAAAQATTRYFDQTTRTWKDRPVTRMRSAARKPARKYFRQTVALRTNEAPGTIIVDTQRKYLYLVQRGGKAIRYGVGVGREGFGWNGVVEIGRKAKWPSWTPPPEMIERERAKGVTIPAFMKGGPANPLGARALYLYEGGRDTIFRIHGTNQPWTIGLNMSSGCIRMMNEDVEHLYERVGRGTKVVVIGPRGQGRPAGMREGRRGLFG